MIGLATLIGVLTDVELARGPDDEVGELATMGYAIGAVGRGIPRGELGRRIGTFALNGMLCEMSVGGSIVPRFLLGEQS